MARSNAFLIFLACVFPPLAVLCVDGVDRSFLINILLTCLGYLPGLIHAIRVVLRASRNARY
ncbi:hypothetical protein G9P44_003415 [Scheffersomyces stipitis]|nr:hypothetical protein G9P44_003415 [Scheffersomyces stipitis]